MKTPVFTKAFVVVLMVVALASHSFLFAASGYMGFLTTPQTVVTTGDAASYMRAGTDWDGATTSGGVATPTLLQKSGITTWRDGSGVHFKFVIPDRTTNQVGGSTTTLACGDQLIVQVGPANSPDAQLQTGKEFRFEVVIQDNLITQQPIGATTTTGPVAKRLPNAIGNWKTAAEASTTANATLTAGGNTYTLTLDIPFGEINNPAGDIGLALAIINDLGHSHGSPAINEASGTAFPIGMGLTPESDPGLSCGALPSGVTATGNWVNPSTWGTGYSSTATVAGDVTLSQSPQFVFSDAIRLGKCGVTKFSDMPAVTAANWMADQQNSPTWYLYNPDGPCRMGIWVNANVAGTGVVKKRFLVVWGRPGISPVDWYFAGLTDPVALSPPNTPISFLWNNVPAITFSDHPCLRVYILPESLTSSQQAAVDLLKNTATATAANLAAMENSFGVAQGSNYSAQMNFANIGTGSCTDQACQPLIGLGKDPGVREWPRFALVEEAFAADTRSAAQVTATGGQSTNQGGTTEGKRPNLVRIMAHGFAVAPPRNNKNYVFVEPIGGLGWAVPANLFGKANMPLNMEVAIPKVAAKMFVGGRPVEILSSPARVYVALVTDALPGTLIPKIDASSLGKFGQTLMTPGEVAKAQINLIGGCSRLRGNAMYVFLLGAVFFGARLYWPGRKGRSKQERGG